MIRDDMLKTIMALAIAAMGPANHSTAGEAHRGHRIRFDTLRAS
ncbi:hypothetical protein BSY16_6157 (plasmid) [Sinorhizobium sp. RAC02]|nr:hypothetical protein BSY16_6157 [Sinorhizobium sp. RAC02]